MAATVDRVSSLEPSEDEIEAEELEETLRKRKTSEPELGEVKYNKKFTTPLRKKRRNHYDPVEEARLERLVFGDHIDVISNLLQDEHNDSKSQTPLSKVSTPNDEVDDSDDNEDNDEKTDDSDLDRSGSEDTEQDTDADSGVEDEELKTEKQAAWVDDDEEENLSVEETLRLQGRRLAVQRPEKHYKELLRNKYQQLVGTPKWAEISAKKETGSEEDSDDEILRHSSHLITPKPKNLAQGTIELKALKNINQETRSEGPVITSLQFHPTSTVALVAGLSGILSIFQIDGKQNTKLHSMQYRRFPINTARFAKEGSEIVVGSQRHAHCHTYDLLAGKTYRVPLPHGMTNMKNFEVSPDEKFIAVCGRMGNIYILTTKTKELVSTLKMNDQCNTLAFSPDSRKLFTHGEGGEIYVWDMNERTCMHRAIDDGCLSGSRIAVSPSGQYLATGSKQGVVNVYDTSTVLDSTNPSPLKIVLNLVTSITSLKFNSASEILSMASDETENAFKMMHLPSATIFSNFPTFRTKFFKPIAVDFSPGSGYLGISNNKGNAYLYRLKHYGNY
ncbi:U3 small nucleolar RNA-associated protein 18 homolog [Neodiprion lecontei]|uniref:U3 small nucleolar RNA-associated protein 18 homolog n=1 Tax=Neodiprion lecontei TaxID=441921 RepID=A0A6J0C4V7_NEOLC|nr:U3 small nucleolar RNA-associated protein 18 homolog [Neodiprion lecontei]